VPSASAYDAVAISKKTEEAARSESSTKVHDAMRADYLAFCPCVGLDPTLVSASTAAHVAKLLQASYKELQARKLNF